MTYSLDVDLWDIARKLAMDLSPGVEERAAQALDAYVGESDLRTIAIMYLVDMARRNARGVAAAAERDATSREIATQVTARTDGHIGSAKPGSWSKRNRCHNCEKCKAGWRYVEEHQAEWDAEDKKRQEEHDEKIRKIYDDYEADIRREMIVEWSKLLGVEIAMPNGERTTWGMATIEQHRLRHEMLVQNAMINAENAARHAEAISLLERTGAVNLHEVVGS